MDSMKTVYILLSRTNTAVGRVIRIATACRYNHVSISLDAARSEFYSFARRRMHNPLIGGFISENVHTGIFGRCGDQPCALYAVTVSDAAYAKLTGMIEGFFARYDAYRYNFLGIPLCLFGIPYARRHHYTCSQFAAYMLQQTGACTLPKAVSLMQPMDFLSIPELRLVYTGPLGLVDSTALHPVPTLISDS